MRVLLIGAGRYGNGLVGRKYASGELGVKLAAVIDPKIDEIKKTAEYCMNGIPTFRSIEDLPAALIRECVADIALIPQVVPEVYGKLVDLGSKQIILPKPVTTNFRDYRELSSITKTNNVQALVASNWHYSEVTHKLKALLEKITQQGLGTDADEKIGKTLVNDSFSIKKVDIEYSKKDEVLTIDAPLQEFPHAMQILISSGIIKNLKHVKTLMDKLFQSKSRINVKMTNVSGVKDGITINSDLKMGEKLNGKRIRKVQIEAEKAGEKAKIIADYDAVFDSQGNCLKNPAITYSINDGQIAEKETHTIKEDNINVMYDKIFNTFRGGENDSITIDDYEPIAEYLSYAAERWNTMI